MITLIRILTLNPYVGNLLAGFLQTILMVVLILNLDRIKIKKTIPKKIFSILKYFCSGIYVIFGILFLDMAIFWLMGAWTTSDWRYQLPGVLLILFLGLEYVIVPLFRKGNLLDIAYFVGVTTSLLIFIHWWVSQFALMGNILEDNIVIMVGVYIIIYLLIGVIKTLKESKEDKTDKEDKEKSQIRYYWDISKKLDKIFNRKTNTIAWVLVVIQGMLSLYGYSLFTFWV
jgi:hypothetical protein